MKWTGFGGPVQIDGAYKGEMELLGTSTRATALGTLSAFPGVIGANGPQRDPDSGLIVFSAGPTKRNEFWFYANMNQEGTINGRLWGFRPILDQSQPDAPHWEPIHLFDVALLAGTRVPIAGGVIPTTARWVHSITISANRVLGGSAGAEALQQAIPDNTIAVLSTVTQAYPMLGWELRSDASSGLVGVLRGRA